MGSYIYFYVLYLKHRILEIEGVKRNISNDKVQAITASVGCCGRAKGKIIGEKIKTEGSKNAIIYQYNRRSNGGGWEEGARASTWKLF